MRTNSSLAFVAAITVLGLAAGPALAQPRPPMPPAADAPPPPAADAPAAPGHARMMQQEMERNGERHDGAYRHGPQGGMAWELHRAFMMGFMMGSHGAGMRGHGENQMAAPMMDRLEAMDTDGDGKVSAAEFEAGLMAAFERLDQNGDGFLDETDRGARGNAAPEQPAGPGPRGNGPDVREGGGAFMFRMPGMPGMPGAQGGAMFQFYLMPGPQGGPRMEFRGWPGEPGGPAMPDAPDGERVR